MAATDHVLANVGGITKRVSPKLIVEAVARLRQGLPSIVGTRPSRYGPRGDTTWAKSGTSRTRHKVLDHVTNLRLVYSGYKSIPVASPPSEVGIGNAYEIKVAIHLISSGVTEKGVIPVLFSGRRLALVPNAGWLVSDPVSVDLPAGAEFFIYTYANVNQSTGYSESGGEVGLMPSNKTIFPREYANRTEAIASTWESGVGMQYTNSTGIDPFGYDKTDGTYAGLTPSTEITVGPAAILGDRLTTTGRPAVAWIGDSILNGTGDWYRADIPFSGRGYADQSTPGQVPGFSTCRDGDLVAWRLGDYAYNFAARWRWVEACRLAYVALGHNDIAGGDTVATIKANLLAFAQQLKDRGLEKIIIATILPKTTTTDGWLTLAGQTPSATLDFSNKRTELNDWIMTVPSPFDDVIDLRTGVEDIATGKWKEPTTSAINLTTTTGSSTTVVQLNSTVVAGAYVGQQLIIGAESRLITGNTATAITVSSGFSGAPGSGVSIVVRDTLTVDGVHPTAWGHKLLAAVLTANESKFLL